MAVEGNKNAALPLLAACLLTEEECTLTNVPRIGDVEVMARLLVDLGAEVDGIGTTTLRVRAGTRAHAHARPHAGGPAARIGAAARPAALARRPGAPRGARRRFPRAPVDRRRTWRRCAPWARGWAAGADHVLEAPDGLKGASMYLYEASVTGTETALLAAARAAGVTEIRHAATEPHVVELCQFLAKMGAGVSGIGSSSLRVEGVPRLRGVQHELGGDYIEAGSWAVVGAITGGEMAIEGVPAPRTSRWWRRCCGA